MNSSKMKYIDQLQEVWGIMPRDSDTLYDISSWKEFGEYIGQEGNEMTIGELLAFVAVFADYMKSNTPKLPKVVENFMDDIIE